MTSLKDKIIFIIDQDTIFFVKSDKQEYLILYELECDQYTYINTDCNNSYKEYKHYNNNFLNKDKIKCYKSRLYLLNIIIIKNIEDVYLITTENNIIDKNTILEYNYNDTLLKNDNIKFRKIEEYKRNILLIMSNINSTILKDIIKYKYLYNKFIKNEYKNNIEFLKEINLYDEYKIIENHYNNSNNIEINYFL